MCVCMYECGKQSTNGVNMFFCKAARASVASTVSELVDVLPKIASCHAAGLLVSNVTGLQNLNFGFYSRNHAKASSGDVVPAASVTALLKEARSVVIAARSALF